MNSTRNPGRVAGFWYLLLIVLGPLPLIYIPRTLFVTGDAPATVSNIAAHDLLFRLGMVAELAAAVILILLVLALYRLFKDVDQNLAVLVVILGGVMPAVIIFVNVVTYAGALMIAQGVDFMSVFDTPQRDALVMLLLRLHDLQNTAAETLWGAWLFPLGILVYRSRLLPRLLGVWLIINGVAYLIMSGTGFLMPQYEDRVFSLLSPARYGELALMLWLVIRGAGAHQLDAKNLTA